MSDNSTDRRLIAAKHGADDFLLYPEGSNLANRSPVRFCKIVSSSFTDRIVRIFLIRSLEKMSRVTATAIVAFVADVKSLFNVLTGAELECYPVSIKGFSTELYPSVSGLFNFSKPWPTLVWLSRLNPFPKSDWKRKEILNPSKGTFPAPFLSLFKCDHSEILHFLAPLVKGQI